MITPLPKVNNPVTYNELRPISLVPLLSKILEKIVYRQLNEYLSVNNVLPVNQSGFRKGHSTNTALINMSDNIIRALDKGQATVLVLLDFTKAFDTIDHSLLVAKCNYFGLNPVSCKFIESYLNNRTQRVVINNEVSCDLHIASGVPQGSVLGPLLFLLYTSDLHKQVNHCNAQFFADDTQLYHHLSISTFQHATAVINNDLSNINNYAHKHNLKLNPSKSKVLLISSKNQRENLKSVISIKIDDQMIPFVNKAKILGVVFDESLRFIDHTNDILKQCYVRLKLLYSSKHILNKENKKMLCESLILSKIAYCNIMYYPCLDTITCNRLQKTQNTCCRFINSLRKYDHLTNAFVDLQWLKLNNLFKYHFLVFVKRLLNTATPKYLRDKLVSREAIHNINVRFPTTLTMPQHKTAIFQRSFTYNAVKLYNYLSIDIKSSSVTLFRKKLKEYLIVYQ